MLVLVAGWWRQVCPMALLTQLPGVVGLMIYLVLVPLSVFFFLYLKFVCS